MHVERRGCKARTETKHWTVAHLVEVPHKGSRVGERLKSNGLKLLQTY
jgi:hypothetical protein